MILDGEELRRCPRRPILEDPALYGELFWLYRQHKEGYLSEAGGLKDQPGKLMDSFRVMDATMNKVAKFREEQQARKARRTSRTGGAARPKRG